MEEKNNYKYSLKKNVIRLFLSGERSRSDIVGEYSLNESTFNKWIDYEINKIAKENSALIEENILLRKVIRILAETTD